MSGSDGGDATIINNGAAVEGGYGSRTDFSTDSSAGSSTLIANGGAGELGYGIIEFDNNSSGGTARVKVFGNGQLWFPYHDGELTLGSIEGDGIVDMGFSSLKVGANDLNTTFRGTLIGEGPLTKIGKGTLTLRGRNDLHEGLIIRQGRVAVNNRDGSGTGEGPVRVEEGTLAGNGIIQGEVTIGGVAGRTAALSPGTGAARPSTLTIQSGLTFTSDGLYHCDINSNTAAADEVMAAGMTIDPAATIELGDTASSILASGAAFTILNNTAATAIAGTFSNLADGVTVTVGSNIYRVNYEGGDGNDLTLTVVP